MPEKKHLRGASAKEQRQYEHILESAKEEGRYGKRAKEVAARTVMKQHGEEGHKPHRSSAGRSTRTSGAKRSASRSSSSKSDSSRSRSSTRSKTSTRSSETSRGTRTRSHTGGRRSGSRSNKS